MKTTSNIRVLIIDDNSQIHEDFRKILLSEEDVKNREMKQIVHLFDEDINQHRHTYSFDVDSAFQGEEGLQKVSESLNKNKPYALAFVDVRMPPGMDGVQTVNKIWKIDPRIQIIICTAYSDYTCKEISDKLGHNHQLLILKKPFDAMEVSQMVNTLTEKWINEQDVEDHINNMRRGLEACTDGVVIFSNHTNHYSIIYANPAANKMLNITTNKDKSFIRMLIQSHRNQPHLALIQQALENQIEGRTELSWTDAEGATAWYQLSVSPIPNSKGMVDRFVGIMVNITEMRTLHNKISNKVTHDKLTGLSNRLLLTDRIKQYIAQAKRLNFIVAVLCIDIDQFSWINDRYGHDAGDYVLQEISRRLISCTRECDTVARVGGDEFIVATMPIAHEKDSWKLAERINERMKEPFTLAAGTFNVTCSIGITLYPEHGSDPSTLLKNADIALYGAKDGGPSNCKIYGG